jgi:hypothetical protein
MESKAMRRGMTVYIRPTIALHLAPDRACRPAKQPGNRALTVAPLQKNRNLASFNGDQVSITFGHEYLPVCAEKIISYLIPPPGHFSVEWATA